MTPPITSTSWVGRKRLFFRPDCAILSSLAPLGAHQTLASFAILSEPSTQCLASEQDLDQAHPFPIGAWLEDKEECPELASGTGGKECILAQVYLMSQWEMPTFFFPLVVSP